jgi:transposase
MGELLSLEYRLLALEATTSSMQSIIDTQATRISELEVENKLFKENHLNLKEENLVLKEENHKLKEEIRKLKIRPNSINSSIPPSKDIARISTKKPASGKKTGGQLGHKGAFLALIDNPDKIVDINPNYCNCCGNDLSNVESSSFMRCQEIDIPPISPITTEFRNHRKKCPNCGNTQSSGFPNHIKNHVQYGPNIQTQIAYNSVYQAMPFKRMTEFFKSIFNLKICQGSIANIIEKIARLAKPLYNHIKQKIQKARIVGSDETSIRVNSEKYWAWVWQNNEYTYISATNSRGYKTIENEFPNGFPNAVLVSDRLPAQLKTPAKAYQICTAHLARDLESCKEHDKIYWPHQMHHFLKKCLLVKKEKFVLDADSTEFLNLQSELQNLLYEEISPTAKKSFTLQKSLQKNNANILTFLIDEYTPPDNNGSERAIRNLKVKQNVSGQFKSGEKSFAILRSVIDTCIKQNLPIFQTAKLIASAGD